MRKITIPAYSYHDSCIGAKRIYTEVWFEWSCPECGSCSGSHFNQVPIISYGEYCHVFVCDDCDYESDDKMYTLDKICDDKVAITLSDKYNLKVFEQVWREL